MICSQTFRIETGNKKTPLVSNLHIFTVICEGEKGWIRCKQYELIKVTRTFWGRDDHVTCPKVPAGLSSDRLCETNADGSVQKVN